MTRQGTEHGNDIAPRLTIVLPLKGRHLFTMRFLWYANEARLPYRFLIADGQVNDAVAHHLENSRETFPHLDIEYVRYPDDAGYRQFFAKMSNALSRVRTPYAMLADNDDFLGMSGIEEALDFLETNSDYVCARGRPTAFQAYSGFGTPDGGVHGSLNSLRMAYESEDISGPLVSERLRQGGLSLLIYYSVYRTAALATLWREDSEIDFTDLMLHETYHAMRTLTLGKVHTNKATITYYSQIGTSTSVDPMRNWVRHLVRSRFTVNTHDVVKRVSSAAAAADGADEGMLAEQVRTIIESYFRDFLWTNYGMVMQIKRFVRAKWPKLVKMLQSRPRFFVVGRERASVLAKLAAAGASEEELNRTRGELAAIEVALSRQSFAEFAAPFLSVARADDSRNWF
jgi:glycosyltransferase domain-containing protein